MAYFEDGSEAMVALEAMVDRVGVRNVLHALAHICRAKADHIRANYQDDGLARNWDLDANRLEAGANKLSPIIAATYRT